MQRMQRLIYFSYIDHNMITIFEYFIIDCHQSLNIAAGRNYSCVHNVQFTFTETILMHLQVVNLLKWSFYMTINTTLPTLSLHLVLFLVPSRFHAASPPPKGWGKYNLNIEYFSTPRWKWISWLYECHKNVCGKPVGGKCDSGRCCHLVFSQFPTSTLRLKTSLILHIYIHKTKAASYWI